MLEQCHARSAVARKIYAVAYFCDYIFCWLIINIIRPKAVEKLLSRRKPINNGHCSQLIGFLVFKYFVHIDTFYIYHALHKEMFICVELDFSDTHTISSPYLIVALIRKENRRFASLQNE